MGWGGGGVPFYFLHFIVLMMGERWGGGCGFMVFSFSLGDLEGGKVGGVLFFGPPTRHPPFYFEDLGNAWIQPKSCVF